MFFEPTLEYTKIHLKIKYFSNNCDNVLDFMYTSDNFSPRMDGKCPKCGIEYSRNIDGLSDSSIVSRKKEEVYR
ncbi:hypothetical protein FC696_07995 [Bacillus wiedmannii]|nr:hypothetical protein FC696_07995 [Bacillus wiedmannii]